MDYYYNRFKDQVKTSINPSIWNEPTNLTITCYQITYTIPCIQYSNWIELILDPIPPFWDYWRVREVMSYGPKMIPTKIAVSTPYDEQSASRASRAALVERPLWYDLHATLIYLFEPYLIEIVKKQFYTWAVCNKKLPVQLPTELVNFIYQYL